MTSPITGRTFPRATAPLRLAVVSGGLRQPSSTRLLSDRLADAAARHLRGAGREVEVTTVELRELAHDLTDHLLTGFPGPALDEALRTVTGADAVVAVTPVFSASYSGLFKSFFDVLEDGALDGVPVLLGATGGTARHSLALEYAVRPLFFYLRAHPVPTSVFAATEDFGRQAAASGAAHAGGSSLADRVDRAAAELAALASGRPARTRTPVDPFADPVPFAELLGEQAG